MKPLTRLILVGIVCLAGSSCARRQAATAVPADQPAEAAVAGRTILFADDFQDGQADDWNVTSAWFVNQNGEAYTFGASGSGGAWANGGSSWTDVLYRAGGRLDVGAMAFIFRMSRSGRYMVQYQADGLYLLKESPDRQVQVLGRADAPAIGRGHSFSIGAYGGHLQVYVDRVLVIDFTDPDPYLQGTVGVGSGEGARAGVDDVIVLQLTRDLPAGQAAAPAPAPAQNAPAPVVAAPPVQEAPEAGSEPVEPVVESPQAAVVSFTIDGGASGTVTLGDCATVAWNVQNSLGVSYQGQPVSAQESREECPAAEGEYTYTLTVAQFDGSSVDESVSLAVTGAPQPPGSPDLVASSVSINPEFPVAGEPVTVAVDVANQGAAGAGAFTVTWNPDASGFIGCSWDVMGLGASASQRLSCQYIGYPQPGDFAWLVNVDPEGEVAEQDEQNNQASRAIFINAPAGPPLPPLECGVSDVGQRYISLVWNVDAQSQQSGFRVYQGGTSLEREINDPGTRGTRIENLDPGVQYHFDVRAFNAGMESDADACFVDVSTIP